MAEKWKVISSQEEWTRLMAGADAPQNYDKFLRASRFEPGSRVRLISGTSLDQVIPLSEKGGDRRRIFEEAFVDGLTVREINSRARSISSNARPDADIFIALNKGYAKLEAGGPPAYIWIFQGNPDSFDLDGYLASTDSILWTVRQKHHAPLMRPGDEVLIWRARGRDKKAVSGVVAHGMIVEAPREQEENDEARSFWKTTPAGSELRVRLQIDRVAGSKKEIVQREWLKEDPILNDLLVLKITGTNFLVDDPLQASRLRALWKNTGRDWDRADSVAGLWAYHQTYAKEVSTKPGSPVVVVAERIGRAVSGVYNKVMNFRAIDPRDSRKGLSGGGASDRAVWQEFYDGVAGAIRADVLESEFRRLWPDRASHPGPVRSVEDLEAAASDSESTAPFDPTDVADGRRRTLAAIVQRQGQQKFRQAVLEAYRGRCAVSGCDVKEALEAAHIYPYQGGDTNAVTNGLLLRADLHTLFDLGFVTIDPETMTVDVAESVRGSAYGEFHGTEVALPDDPARGPSTSALAWHRREIGERDET